MKTSLRKLACIALTLSFCGSAAYFPAPALANADTAPAVLIASSGTVTIERDGVKIQGTFGLPLQVGDAVKTGEGATAQILFEAGNVVQIGPNSSIQIQSSPKAQPAEPVTGESPAANRNIEVVQNFIKLKNKEGTSSLSRLRSGNEAQDLAAVSPGRSRIRSARPDFTWEIENPSTELRLTVYDESGVFWKRDVSGTTSLSYPEDAPVLESGISYSWTLETTDPLMMPPLRSKAVFFEVISADDAKALDVALVGISKEAEPNASSYHLIRASLFFDGGLLEDAIMETEGALEADPTNAGLRSILARLYAEVGRPDAAMAEFDRIIESR